MGNTNDNKKEDELNVEEKEEHDKIGPTMEEKDEEDEDDEIESSLTLERVDIAKLFIENH